MGHATSGCASDPGTCLVALRMAVEIFPEAACRLWRKGNCGERQLKGKQILRRQQLIFVKAGGAACMGTVVLLWSVHCWQ